MAERKPLFISSEGYSEEMATSDTATFGGLTLGGNIVMQTNKITGLGDPTSAQDAATKYYVDSVATGLDLKASCRVKTVGDYSAWIAAGSGVGATLTSATDATSNNDFDGVTVSVGNRILVTSHGGDDVTPDADNGIYVVTTLADGAGQETVLTRATDADQNAEVTAGMFSFVTEGTVAADTGWVLVTNDSITVDTTALMFSQFSSAVTVTYDQGLSYTAGSVKVELDTSANAQGAGAGGGSSGLEFDANNSAGKLRAAVHATGGLERTASGLAAKLNGSSLASASGGLSVSWAPILMESYVVNEAIAVADPVYWSSTSGRVGKALANDTSKANVIGVAKTAQGSAGSNADIVMHGICAGALSGATPGTQYYLAASGGITTTRPSGSANRILSVGFAATASNLFVRIADFGRLAA